MKTEWLRSIGPAPRRWRLRSGKTHACPPPLYHRRRSCRPLSSGPGSWGCRAPGRTVGKWPGEGRAGVGGKSSRVGSWGGLERLERPRHLGKTSIWKSSRTHLTSRPSCERRTCCLSPPSTHARHHRSILSTLCLCPQVSSELSCPRVFADDARGWQCPFVLCTEASLRRPRRAARGRGERRRRGPPLLPQ